MTTALYWPIRAMSGAFAAELACPWSFPPRGDITRGRRDVTAGFVGSSSQRRPPRARHDDDAVDRIAAFKAA